MGLLYELDCSKCGYHFIALYGRGGSEEPQIKAKKRLETFST